MKLKLIFRGLLLCFCIGALFSQTAVAPNGSGTSGDPYQIASLENLYWVSQNASEWDKDYIQTASIDASETSSWNGGLGWSPIGSSTNPFTGSYDGNSNIISGLYINRPTENYLALFGKTENATIENIRLFDGSVTGDHNCAILIAVAKQTSTSNCGTTGNVTCNQVGGGLIGTNYNYSSIDNSYSEANVNGPTNDGHYRFGGLIGVNSTYSQINNCYAKGNVSGYQYVGGFVGYNGEAYYVANDNSSIYRSYSTGSVTGTLFRGGFCGINDDGCYINMCFWDYQTANESYSPYGMEKSTADMKTQSTYTTYGWDFTSIWTIDVNYNNGYPVQIWQTQDPDRIADAPLGVGSLEDPYQIASLANLYWIAEDNSRWSSHYIQTADIDASATSAWFVGKGWSPLGNYTIKFTGSYDGQGYYIDNLYINRPAENYVGLFGYLQSGSVSNLNIRTSNVTGGNFTGGLVGYTYYQASVENSSYSGDVAGGTYVGGLVGQNYSDSDILNCFSDGTVAGTGSMIGGLVGYNNYNCDVSNCYSRSDVSGGTEVGGLAGKHYYSDITNCYSNGSVSGSSNTGGLVGEATINYSTRVNDSFWDTETSGLSNSDGGTGKTTADMKNSTTYTNAGWDLFLTWGRSDDSNDGYPFLRTAAEEQAPLYGAGTEVSPYQIHTSANLYWLSQNSDMWDKHYIQTADIDLSVSPAWTTGSGFTPIGNSSTKFTGSYDGQGYTINGLYINRSSTDYIGLFGYVSDSRIYNAHLTNSEIIGDAYTGGLAGRVYDTVVEQCSSSGSVTGASGYVGGLTGYNASSTICDCSSSGSVTGSGNYIGGIAGYNAALIGDCYSTASVTSSGSYVGGVAGRNSYKIINSYSSGSVHGDNYVGGLLGYNYESSLVSQCYSIGAVSDNGSSTYTGGLIGSNYYSSVISNSFWDTQTSGQASSAGGTGKTTAEMQTQSTFDDAGWSFIHKWSIDGGYPYLQQRSDKPVSAAPTVGDGSENSPYQISNISELYWIYLDEARWSLHYIQTADFDAIQTGTWNYGWKGIGNSDTKFTGSYDGQGHNIDNLYINRESYDYVGLFGYIDSAVVRDVYLSNNEIMGENYTAGLVGYAAHSSIEACSAGGSVNGNAYNGALIGRTSSSTVKYCSVSGSVMGVSTHTGGLVGYNYATDISECYSSASVTSTSSYVGGLAGDNYNGSSILNSYSIGNVHGDDRVGGLVGYNYTSEISHCYSIGAVTENGSADHIGGLVGSSPTSGSVTYSFWDTETSGQTSSDGGTGKTTGEMKTQSTFENAGWDFVSTWLIDNSINSNYPALLWQIDPVSPVITTGTVVDQAKDSVRIQYSITEPGLPTAFQHGVCWDTTGIPDINGNLTNEGRADSSGVFTSVISGLTANSFYIARPYIMSAVDTVYGDTLSFKTLGNSSISTISVTDIDTSSVKLNAEIFSLGNPTPTGHGFLWGEDEALNRLHLGAVDSAGIFHAIVSELQPNTNYLALAYVATPGDTILTDTVSFKTLGYPEVTTRSIDNTGMYTATVSGMINDPGNPTATQHGFCWSTAVDPTIEDRKVELGPIDSTATYSADIDSLEENTLYFVRTFATNDIGTVYGDTLSFMTLGLPAVTEIRVSEIDTNRIIANADIISLGNPAASEHGFAWAMDNDSALTFDHVFLGRPDSIGTYSSTIGSLKPNSTYHLYAFVSNGNDTVHTDTIMVKTYGLPSVSILSLTDIDSISVTASGRIEVMGNPGILQHGFCWSTDVDPTIEDHMLDLGTLDSMDIFQAAIDSLTQNTRYYIRAFASNEVGVSYSDTLSFITLETSIYDMIPGEFTLNQNYPNPFNPTTTLQYGLPEVSDVKIIIFDILGRKIKEWSINGQHAGWHKIMWDGSDTGGNTVSTGVYIYSLKAGKFVDTKKMLFMK